MRAVDFKIEKRLGNQSFKSIQDVLEGINAQIKVKSEISYITVEFDENQFSAENIQELIEREGFRGTVVDLWNYFTAEQQHNLLNRNKQLGENGIKKIQLEGRKLVDALTEYMATGVSVKDHNVQQTASRIKELLDSIRNYDSEIHEVVERFHYDFPDYSLAGMNLKLYQYYKKAIFNNGITIDG
jgi:copper chaperone CopZ